MTTLRAGIPSPLVLACPADPLASGCDACVLGREGMPMLAMCLHSMRRTQAAAAAVVLCWCDEFKVRRIYAATVQAIDGARANRRVMAGMVKVHSSRDRADQQLIPEPVGIEDLPAYAQFPVAIRPDLARPEPATVCLIRSHPESNDGILHSGSLDHVRPPRRSRTMPPAGHTARGRFHAIFPGQRLDIQSCPAATTTTKGPPSDRRPA